MYFEVQILGKLAIQGQFNNQIWISYTNAFSSGLFLAVGIIHILSESSAILAEYVDYPISYLLAILGFSLVLFIEKIYFRNVKEIVHSDENIELQQMDKQGNTQGVLLESHEQKQTQQLVNSLKDNKNNLRPYLLSIAIGIHAVFEGLALGVSRQTADIIGLGLSLMAHKWAEGWALGVAFRESSVVKEHALKFIVIQAALSPVGVSLGMMIAGESILITGIVQSFTAGTFVYIATTELIVEEFNKEDNQLAKFILYLLGIAFISLLVYLE